MKRLILALFILLLASCIPYSDNPLSDPFKEPLDSAIFGAWFWNEENDHGYVHIGIDTDKKTLLVTMIEYKSEGKMEVSDFRGHTTKLGQDRFLNLKWIKPKELYKGYLLVKYDVTADTLTIWLPDLPILDKAVKAKALQGEVLPSGDVVLHANQAELRDYISKNKAALFPHGSTLKRLVLPRTPKQETSKQ